ncbi:PHB depolymerase family esterase [Mesorhizobium sp. KR2-14]|uniref:extracellular catalytic domain type 1 short-chain-length polyhydroxyalkanoate depolymerase n=1 Tax=Mesorhizobium sp. KR2-14 TaxID=3156610 RepID=UPI0032B3B836
MRKIFDTIVRLAALRAQHTVHSASSGINDHLQTLTGFGSNPGALAAKCYLPTGLPEGAPLVVVLHGCTQNAAGYDHHSGWSQLAAEAGFALLYPEQQRANNPNLCFNWFQPADTRRDMGEALSIRQMMEAMVLAHGLDRKRIFITGLSAGGAMAAVMLATYPEVFAGGAIIAGLPYGSATTVPQAFDRMRGQGGPSQRDLQQAVHSAADHPGPWPRISIWQGSADQTVAPSNAEAIAAQWLGVHGLDKKRPTHSETAGRLSRQVWCNATGETMIEINSIVGMGHGTPIGNDDLGAPGPFMLDAGISSTRETARFWEIAAMEKNGSTISRSAMPAGQRPPPLPQMPDTAKAKTVFPELTAIQQAPCDTSPEATGIRKIIEDALRAAGLMR